MYTAKCTLIGSGDLMFGGKVGEKKKHDETSEQHEQRTWKQKVHIDNDGHVFLQPFAIKNGLESAGKWLSMGIPGEGKKTYTARFRQGIVVTENVAISHNGGLATIDDIEALELFVPSDGKHGGSRRVNKIFPTLHEWRGSVSMLILDDVILEKVLLRHLTSMGQFIGLGSMRCENGGVNGRFQIEDFATEKVEA